MMMLLRKYMWLVLSIRVVTQIVRHAHKEDTRKEPNLENYPFAAAVYNRLCSLRASGHDLPCLGRCM